MFKSSVKIAAAAAMFLAAGKTGSADVWSCEDWPAECASRGHEPGYCTGYWIPIGDLPYTAICDCGNVKAYTYCS